MTTLAILAENTALPSLGNGAISGLVSTPDVCGGEMRIEGTRIPVWVLESYRRLGKSESDLLRNYPSLTRSDLQSSWAYVASHGNEIEEAIRRNEEA